MSHRSRKTGHYAGVDYASAHPRQFRIAGPIGLAAVLVALLLLEVPLRDTTRAAATGDSGVGKSFAAPPSNSYDELRELVSAVALKTKNDPQTAVLERSGVPLPLNRPGSSARRTGHRRTTVSLDEIAEMTKVPLAFSRRPPTRTGTSRASWSSRAP